MSCLDLNKDTKPTKQSIAKFMDKRVELGNLLESSDEKYDMVIVSRDDVLYSNPVIDDVTNLDFSKK